MIVYMVQTNYECDAVLDDETRARELAAWLAHDSGEDTWVQAVDTATGLRVGEVVATFDADDTNVYKVVVTESRPQTQTHTLEYRGTWFPIRVSVDAHGLGWDVREMIARKLAAGELTGAVTYQKFDWDNFLTTYSFVATPPLTAPEKPAWWEG